MVGIIPKTIEKSPPWQDILFYFSIGLLLASAFSFFVLNDSLKKAENSLQSIEQALAKTGTADQLNMEKEIKITEKQVKDFSQIIDSHIYPSKIFDFLPKIIHPRARFKQTGLDAVKSEVNVSGEAESITALQQQIFIFQKEPLIKSFTFNSFSFGEKGKVNFNFNLSINPRIFNQ